MTQPLEHASQLQVLNFHSHTMHFVAHMNDEVLE